MDVAPQPAAFAANDKRYFAMGLHPERDAVGNVDAGTLQRARPADVAFFVETRLQFDEHRDLLLVVPRLEQRVNDR